jgi:hypothetical protein
VQPGAATAFSVRLGSSWQAARPKPGRGRREQQRRRLAGLEPRHGDAGWRDPGPRRAHSANRLAALLIGGVSFWAGCEVLWNSSGDPASVLRLVRLSALGWAALGPLSLHLFLEITSDPAPRVRRVLPVLYVASAFFAVSSQVGLIHPGVDRQSWGWSYDLAPPTWPSTRSRSSASGWRCGC